MTSLLPIELIDEQADFIIINKPANINFHDEGNIGQGLHNQVKSTLSLNELYPVHRLDKMTSGLLIFAKNQHTAKTFQTLFEQHKIQKYYLAISDQKPTKKQGLIKGDMVKSRRGSWKLLRTVTNPAISQFFSYSIEQGKRLYLIKPHSGKTHQIRVALNSIGASIIGDPNYNATSIADRGYLHAFALQFMLNNKQYQYINTPQSGELFTLASTQKSLTTIAEPWLLPWPKI